MAGVEIDITSSGKTALAQALTIVWPNAAGGVATHYKVIRVAPTVSYYARLACDKLHANVTLPSRDLPELHISHTEYEREDEAGAPTLILLWHEENGALPLPYPLDLERAADFLGGWLLRVDYGEEPDHDGDNGKGWRIFNESWGHVVGNHFGIVAIQPAWIIYPK
jgi:hypothetical protein